MKIGFTDVSPKPRPLDACNTHMEGSAEMIQREIDSKLCLSRVSRVALFPFFKDRGSRRAAVETVLPLSLSP